MSRCFPFPPPGYEQKFKAESLDLLTKIVLDFRAAFGRLSSKVVHKSCQEKHKEKKHKKEKKDKEKREHKDKKEKDRNKDKHKEKKDRKDKHRDRKRSKDISDKGRPSEDNKVENQNQTQSDPHIRESLPKAEQVNNSKFAEELSRRIRDDGATNQLVGTSTTSSSIHRKLEGLTAANPLFEKERGTDKKPLPIDNIASAQRNSASGPHFENAASSLQRKAESIGTAASMEKERSKMLSSISSEPNRNHGISRPDTSPWLVNRKTEQSTPNCLPPPPRPGQLGAKVVSSTSASTPRRNNAIGLAAETPPGHCKNEVMPKPESASSLPAIEKERIKGRETFSRPVSNDQRTKPPVIQRVENDRYQKLDEQKRDEVSKRLEQSKPKYTDRYANDKEKEEKITKPERIETDKSKNIFQKDKVDTLNSKPLAPHKDVDMNVLKRKLLKTNGFLHDTDARPSKVPRLSSPQPPVVHRTVDPHPNPPVNRCSKDGDMNTINNAKRINGTSRGPLENGDVSSKLPHPDSKYLHQIYSVPKMEPWPEADEMGWLFQSYKSQPSRKAAAATTKHKDAENSAQVWAEPIWIDDTADSFALPYVLPF